MDIQEFNYYLLQNKSFNWYRISCFVELERPSTSRNISEEKYYTKQNKTNPFTKLKIYYTKF